MADNDNFKPLFGWLGPEAAAPEMDQARREGFLIPFSQAEEMGILDFAYRVPPQAMKPVWEISKDVLGYVLPAGRQEIGDCVSWGMKQAGEYRQLIEIAAGQEEKFQRWFAPWIYAISRNQIGRGRISGDGSLGVWAAKGVSEYGVLFEEDEGVPRYSGSLARQWGSPRNAGSSPEYARFFPIAKDNPCICVEVKSVEEAVKMIRDYRRPLTIASMRGFQMQPRNYKGYHVFTPSGSWAHQMCFIEYNEELPALYRLNSWGANAHGQPLRGETPGGAWNLLDDIEREFRSMSVECFALVDFEGQPGPPDWRPIREGN